VPTGPAAPGPSVPGPILGPVENFFAELDSPDFSIVAKVSEPEVEQAITLFSVVNMLIAGKGERVVGRERKTDVLGVLTIYYGMQDRTLASRILVNSQQLFGQIDAELKQLRDDLDRLGADVDFLEREARRQFNLGGNAAVAGNTEFPRLFKRYVEIATDPLLVLDLAAEQASPFGNKEQVARAFDLLREQKDVVVGIVRSLSKSGSIATARVNADWTAFEGRAMALLVKVAAARLTEDSDAARPLAVLADLSGRSLDSDVIPYVALAREGGLLLDLALEAYRHVKDALEDYDERTLLDLFQAPGAEFLTTRMRKSAVIVRQYGPAGWG
jgi:hypothetical protein